MTIAGASNLQASQAQFEALYQQVWNQPLVGSVALECCNSVATDGKYLRIPVVTSYPRFRQWNGEKAIKDLRAFEQTIEVVPYEASVGLKRLFVETDRSGAVNASLTSFLTQAKNSGVDDLLITQLLANTWTSYDGVTLLNAAHTFMNGTGNNLTTSALSFSTYRAGKQAMALFADEDGRPLNIFPTHLVVGPAQERIAKEIIGADRPVNVTSAGALDGAVNVVGITTIPNVFQGDTKLIVSPWITGNQWFLIHASSATGLTPFVRAVFREIEPQVKDGRDMLGNMRFMRDEYVYSLEGDMGFGAGLPQCIYGSVTA